jgi:hypothetical protein
MALRGITAVSIFAMAILLGGCNEGRKPEECWSADTKTLASNITKQIIVEQIEAIIKAGQGGKPLTQEKKIQIEQSANVVLSDFYVYASMPEVQRLTCGTSVSLTYQAPDGTILAGDTVSEFDVLRSESGFAVTIPRAALVALVTSLDQ